MAEATEGERANETHGSCAVEQQMASVERARQAVEQAPVESVSSLSPRPSPRSSKSGHAEEAAAVVPAAGDLQGLVKLENAMDELILG